MGKMLSVFIKRDKYRIELRRAIKRHGLANLPKAVLRTVPTDMKTLYELPWYLNLHVIVRIVQASILNAQNEAFRRALNA